MNIKNKKYDFLSKIQYSYKNYHLLPLRKKDIQKIRKWRNENLSILRQQKILTKEEQNEYYDNVVTKTFFKKEPSQILFSFLNEDDCIGYGGFVHIDWKEKISEISFLIDTNRSSNKKIYENDFKAFYKIIKDIAFLEINFQKLITETYDIRPFHKKLLENSGFKLIHILKDRVQIENVSVDSLIHECKNEFKKN